MSLWDIFDIPLKFFSDMLESGYIYVLIGVLIVLAIWLVFR